MGLTFKPNTDDMRESPAIYILGELEQAGAQIKVHDPEGMEHAKILLPDSIVYCDSMYDVCHQTDVLVLMTEWDSYKNLDFELIQTLMCGQTVVDLRNIYERKYIENAGFQYYGVGC